MSEISTEATSTPPVSPPPQQQIPQPTPPVQQPASQPNQPAPQPQSQPQSYQAPAPAINPTEYAQMQAKLKMYEESGAADFVAVQQGDFDAAIRLRERMNGSVTPQHQQPAPQPYRQEQPQEQQPNQQQEEWKPNREEYEEIKRTVQANRLEQINGRIQQVLEMPDYKHLAQNPNARQMIISEISRLTQTAGGKAPTQEQIVASLKVMDQNEKTYQDRVLQSRAGELGVNEPFRGSMPTSEIQERPNFITDKVQNKKWINQRLIPLLRQDAEAIRTGQMV